MIIASTWSWCFPCLFAVLLAPAVHVASAPAAAEAKNDSGSSRNNKECAAVREWCDQALLGKTTSSAPAEGRLKEQIPFSFTYNGRSSSELLPQWTRKASDEPPKDGVRRHSVTWTDEKTGLEVACEATVFTAFPAVEWLLRLKNTSDKDTPIIEDIRPLDLGIAVEQQELPVFHHARGSTATANDYEPLKTTLQAGQEVSLPNDNAISQTYLPYFNLQWSDGGVVGATGWTGQWALSVKRGTDGISLRAGQQITHLKLLPGESIRTPRILLVSWQGTDRMRGHNLLRGLLITHYLPRVNGQVVLPPISQNTWSVHNKGNATTEQNQIAVIEKMPSMGMEAYWLDAGWHVNGYPRGMGNWTPRKDNFPNGLRPVADAAHTAGLKFILWFAPEHVAPNTAIARAHPEWALVQKNNKWSGGFPDHRLFMLGDLQARKWMTDFLSKCISDYGVDVFRQDRGFYPALILREYDSPDRQGIAEIRHVEGLYAMWDELLARHPGLVIDSANWRGIGPDLETMRRISGSWTYSEAANCGENRTYNQQQMMGVSFYLPLHANGLTGTDPYTVRSVAGMGVTLGIDTRSPQFPLEEMRRASEEIKSLRPLYLGDYYPLIEAGLDEQSWCGWQFDRPDLGKGFALCFRRPQFPDSAHEVAMKGLDPSARYEVTFAETYEVKESQTLTGKQLTQLKVEIGKKPGSMLIRYSKLPSP